MTVIKNKELYEALLEAGASTDKAASARMFITPDSNELSQSLIELKKSTIILKFAVLFVFVVEVLPYLKLF